VAWLCHCIFLPLATPHNGADVRKHGFKSIQTWTIISGAMTFNTSMQEVKRR